MKLNGDYFYKEETKALFPLDTRKVNELLVELGFDITTVVEVVITPTEITAKTVLTKENLEEAGYLKGAEIAAYRDPVVYLGLRAADSEDAPELDD